MTGSPMLGQPDASLLTPFTARSCSRSTEPLESARHHRCHGHPKQKMQKNKLNKVIKHNNVSSLRCFSCEFSLICIVQGPVTQAVAMAVAMATRTRCRMVPVVARLGSALHGSAVRSLGGCPPQLRSQTAWWRMTGELAAESPWFTRFTMIIW